MKKIIIPFFCAVLFSTSAVAQQKAVTVKASKAQSVPTSEQVIYNYLKALGGKEKLEAVKSSVIDNTLSVQGMEVSMTTKKMGNKFRSEQSVMGQKMIQVFDGEKGYMDQMGQKMDIPAD